MAEEVVQSTTASDLEGITQPTSELVMMDTTTRELPMQEINVVDDATLQAVLSSMTDPEMQVFLDELNKTGKAYLSSIGQTIELLTIPTPAELPTTSQSSAEILQELTSLIQQPIETKPTMHINTSGSRQARTANTYGGTSMVSGSRPGTAVKSTISASSGGGGGTTIRKPFQQQQQQTINDDRMFFGRPTSTGQEQYHHRTGLMPNKQVMMSSEQQERRMTTSSGIDDHQRRPLSWFPNRPRRHSSDDGADSDLDSSPPSYFMGSTDNSGPTRRSTRVPKPKQDADFVTFPLLDRDEHGNPIPPTPSSMPLHQAEDDEDDIPYRLMDYPRPLPQAQSSNTTSSITSTGPGRKPRTVAEMRTAIGATKQQARWPDDELYHVKSFVPLIMPQQKSNPSTMKNKMTMCKPLVSEQEVEAKPTRCTIATQTEMEYMIPDVPLVSLPVPIYLPSPTPSYQLFQPRAVPIPVPVFIPILIPIPKKTFQNIRDYLQSQRDLLPDDPFEAALVMHAESLVRAENQPQQSTINTNESVMMMDLTCDDSYLTTTHAIESLPELDLEVYYIDPVTSNDPEFQKLLRMLPDAGDRLKWTFGVSAFQQWCTLHNQSILSASTLEDIAVKNEDLIKFNLLSYSTGDDFQHVMDIFLREVRRPTGEEYLPESIYYLCLGIQFYLKINNRPIELFDPRHIQFNSTLTKILSHYSPRDSNTHVSLIDEDLLYDIHQFGILTPWSLLTTLIYTNTKYFNLKSVEAHTAISFANFGKYSQWGRSSPSAVQGQQMHYLSFYAHNPDLKSLANSPTVYEITERVNDPVRCPIKQYDFYVSKCPEQIRGTADVFYLQPILDQNPDNSIWYSDAPLSSTIFDQILTRLKLLPDFARQSQPVEMASSSANIN